MWKWKFFLLVLVLLTGCATSRPPLPKARDVSLPRFMGTWYVMGYTPIVVDHGAYNAVEHYAIGEPGRILTTYQFRKGSADGKLKTYTPTGFIHDTESNVEWRMQFVWPFKAEYIVVYRSNDYQQTIIAHPNRKYAWIMARSPIIDESVYEDLISKLVAAGFDRDDILRVPHDWSSEDERLAQIKQAGSALPLAPR